MPTKPKPRGLPLGPELGPRVGIGQDNEVFDLLSPAPKPHLRESVGFVAKVSHEQTKDLVERRGKAHSAREAAESGIQYKKHKYDILKHFLGDNIPRSGFVLTEAEAGSGKRYVELTLQEKVPQFKLSDLTPEQREDPRLSANVSTLLARLQRMYSVMGEANARVGQNAQLDAKLDLGGVSDRVRAEDMDHRFAPEEVQDLIDTNKSPNLLVDPESMQLYCIDFDQGQWNEGMSATAEMVHTLDARRNASALGGLAINA
ncbi:MAG: hypothetical protein WAS36_03395 [Candidatus Saccharimonadales bacterium]